MSPAPRKTPRPGSSLGERLVPLLLAFVTIGVLALMLSLERSSDKRNAGQVADIAVEHTQSLRLNVTVSQGKIPMLFQVSHDGAETIPLSIPDTWRLQEVRLATLADVPSDPPALNFRRWHLPANAIVTFAVPSPPSGVRVLNPSKVPLEVRVKRIDLLTSKTDTNVILIKDDPLRIF